MVAIFRYMARCSYPTRTPLNPVSAKALSGMHSSQYLQSAGCALLPLQIATIFSHRFEFSKHYSYLLNLNSYLFVEQQA